MTVVYDAAHGATTSPAGMTRPQVNRPNDDTPAHDIGGVVL